MGTLFLPKQHKHPGPCLRFATRGKQSEIPHAMLAGTRHLVLENGDKLFVGKLHPDMSTLTGVFGQIFDLTYRKNKNSFRTDRPVGTEIQSSSIPISGVSNG